MSILHILESKMIYIVFILMGIAILTGFYYHSIYLNLKSTLPIALLLMLYQPMVYLDITKALTKRTTIKTKYLVAITTYYLIVFPVITYLFFYSWRILFPSVDPRIVAGMVLISLAPIPSSAPAFTNIAGGAVQLTLIGVVWTFLLSIFAMPTYAKLLLHTVIVVPIGLMIKSLIIYVITPLLLGQATKYLVLKTKGEKLLISLKNPLKTLSLLGLYWMIIVVFGINSILIISKPYIILVGFIAMNIYFLVRVGIMYLTGKSLAFPHQQHIALVFSAYTNMTIATAIAIGVYGPVAALGTALGGPFSAMIQMILLSMLFKGKTRNLLPK